ncbi:hypothetical protein CPC08DRAFT_731260, partial [Agrocybe pediades]
MSSVSRTSSQGPRAVAANITVPAAATGPGNHLLCVFPQTSLEPQSLSVNPFIRNPDDSTPLYTLQDRSRQEDLYQEYCKLQEENARLRQENKCLSDLNENQAFAIQNLSKRKGRRGKAAASTSALEAAAHRLRAADSSAAGDANSSNLLGDDLDQELKLVTKRANHFVLFYYPYAEDEDFTRPAPDFAPHSMERFATDADTKLGVTADLYSFVEPKFRALMQASADTGKNLFIGVFREAMSSARSHALSKIRTSMNKIFPKLPGSVISLPVGKRSRHPDIQKLAGFIIVDNGNGSNVLEYPDYSPFFYPDEHPGERGHLFLSEYLYRIEYLLYYYYAIGCTLCNLWQQRYMLARGGNPSFKKHVPRPYCTISVNSAVTRNAAIGCAE